MIESTDRRVDRPPPDGVAARRGAPDPAAVRHGVGASTFNRDIEDSPNVAGRC